MCGLKITLLVVCILLAILFIVARVWKGGLLGVLIKTLASFGFVTSGIIGLIISDASNSLRWVIGLIVIGLLFGMIGDIVLDLKVVYPGNDKYFLNSGMLSFFLGHVCYIVAFSLYIDPIQRFTSAVSIIDILAIGGGVAVLLTAGITLSSKKMGLNFGNYLIQTIAYTFILSLSMIYVLLINLFVTELWLAFVGLVLFFLSDVVLSFQYFGGKISSKPLIVINHALYYAAQIILVAVIFVL